MPQKNFVNNAGLGFGRFVAAGGGAITVAPSGVRTRSGGVVLLASPAGAASYTISDNG